MRNRHRELMDSSFPVIPEGSAPMNEDALLPCGGVMWRMSPPDSKRLTHSGLPPPLRARKAASDRLGSPPPGGKSAAFDVRNCPASAQQCPPLRAHRTRARRPATIDDGSTADVGAWPEMGVVGPVRPGSEKVGRGYCLASCSDRTQRGEVQRYTHVFGPANPRGLDRFQYSVMHESCQRLPPEPTCASTHAQEG